MQSPRDQAQAGLRHIENAILSLLEVHPDGLINAEIAKLLGIESGEPGKHRNMLSWSIIERLMASGRVERVTVGKRKLLRLKAS